MIFSGKAGGFLGELFAKIGEVRGIEYAPIKFEVADDLSFWSAEIPEKVVAKAEALAGSMTPLGESKLLMHLEVRQDQEHCYLGKVDS
jgi:hypothetical protein